MPTVEHSPPPRVELPGALQELRRRIRRYVMLEGSALVVVVLGILFWMSLAIDYAMNARSLGANVIECRTYEDYVAALKEARQADRTTVICIRNDRYVGVPGYESWWDVQVAEVSEMPAVQAARQEWEEMRAKERYYL